MESEGSLPAVTSAHHLSLFWASSIQSILPHPTSWKYPLLRNHSDSFSRSFGKSYCIGRWYTNYTSFLIRSREPDAVCFIMRHISWDRSDSFFRFLVPFNRESSWYDLSDNFALSEGNTLITTLAVLVPRLSYHLCVPTEPIVELSRRCIT
jgi:hypothetical protein